MEKLTLQEIEAFRVISKENFISSDFDNRLLNHLIDKKLINKQSKTKEVMKKRIIQIAAAIILALGSYFLGNMNFNNASMKNTQNEYALFLYENQEFKVEDPNSLVSEYKNWAIDLGKEQKLVYAEKLNDNTEYWFGKQTVKNSTSKLTGYFVFYANDYDEAKQIATSHPHVKYGGGVELRLIDKIE